MEDFGGINDAAGNRSLRKWSRTEDRLSAFFLLGGGICPSGLNQVGYRGAAGPFEHRKGRGAAVVGEGRGRGRRKGTTVLAQRGKKR